MRPGVVDQRRDRRLVIRHATPKHLGAAGRGRAGVMVAFGYVDADEHLDIGSGR